MALLDIYAGKNAINRIRNEGFSPELFDYMLGASGGPKWFVLAGLDRYIFTEFFKGRSKPLDIIGSSAGAFRFACFAQEDPLAATNRLAQRYSTTQYSDSPTPKEITDKGIALLDYVLGDTGAKQIVDNPVIKAHFIVAKCKGLTQFESKPLQLTGLVASAGANALKRKWLNSFYERFVFSAPSSSLSITDPYGLKTQSIALTDNNLSQALMASGSIPLIIEGVKNISGAPHGMYRDGGIIDYHFDLSFGPQKGLVFYPHFNKRPIPGWFDKSLKNRLPHNTSYDDVVMLVPSDEFISQLPYAKIPDRKDFETMPALQRIPYWEGVINQSDKLGQEFAKLYESQTIIEHVKPFDFL
ncbi:patatin-like phospholipase family protein [Paraglaciecola sp. 2405UD69-4]|uniref:patatin-like phospholipase family protein n=1 Tax=Paraglaciecola sp. 2405UD69-4 TaxID=3391836 RepID=UPI0039C92055